MRGAEGRGRARAGMRLSTRPLPHPGHQDARRRVDDAVAIGEVGFNRGHDVAGVNGDQRVDAADRDIPVVLDDDTFVENAIDEIER